MSEIKDVVLPILKNIQADNAAIKTGIGALKENTGRMDMRMKAIESHMSGFMSTTRYLEGEIDELRGRVEQLEETIGPKD